MKGTHSTRPPQPRVLNFTPAVGDLGATVRLDVGKDSCHYGIEEIAAFPGERAFNVTRLDIGRFETYTVRATSRQHAECDCPGNAYKGRCKHADAVIALIGMGKLSSPAPTQAQRDAESCELESA